MGGFQSLIKFFALQYGHANRREHLQDAKKWFDLSARFGLSRHR